MIHLSGLTLEELTTFTNKLGERPFRAGQIFEWIHKHNAEHFSDMTSLSHDLQERLSSAADVSRIILERKIHSDDGAIKFLFKLHDGNRVETVFLPENSRKTICLSSQVGCAFGCSFCATGRMNLTRNLTAGEIADQYAAVERITGNSVTNIVFMGMGEPLHNYDNVIKAASIFNNKLGKNIGARHITISTVGLADKIALYFEEGHNFKLAISINAGSEEVRRSLMPVSKKYPLNRLVDTLKKYARPNSRLVTFEYVLLKGINDSEREIDGLISHARSLPVKINLIPYNPIDAQFIPPDREKIREIYDTIRSAGIQVNIRKSLGKDIQGACGQLITSPGSETTIPEQVH